MVIELQANTIDKSQALIPGRQFVFNCKVKTAQGNAVNAEGLTDSGATGNCVSDSYAQRTKLQRLKLQRRLRLKLGDGVTGQTVTHAALVPVYHGDHYSEELMYVIDMKGYDLIFGTPWLEKHNPRICWRKHTMTFDDDDCFADCLIHGKPVVIHSKNHKKAAPTVLAALVGKDIFDISGRAATAMLCRQGHQAIWMLPEHFERLEGDEPLNDDVKAAFRSLFTMDLAAFTQDDIDKFHNKMNLPERSPDEIRKMLPDWLHDFVHMFNMKNDQALPPYRRGVDHEIVLEDGKFPAQRMYGLSRDEGLVVKAYLEDMLAKGEIKHSTSRYASPVLVVRKPGGGLRVCVDYRQLNAVTVKSRNAPPSIKETLGRLSGIQYLSIMDIVAAFNRVRIKKGDEETTAFLTRYGLFEYLVMPFGLCNAPSSFQKFINEVLREYLDEFCSAYLDDILVFSKSVEEHQRHVCQVLSRLSEAGLYLDIDKCKFAVKKVKYLGLIITTDGIEMDPAKVKAIEEWMLPTSLKELQSFLGFTNFYRRFILGYSDLTRPLTDLTRQSDRQLFPLGQRERLAFEAVKRAFLTSGALMHFDPRLETWVETDASDYVTAAVLSQMDKNGVLRPVAFMSTKMSPAECNYAIYDKELLAIVKAFEEWRPELCDGPVNVVTDHRSLEWFMTNKKLNRRQARWAEFLAEFNFKITYRPGRQGTKPDALTRRPGDTPQHVDDDRIQHQMQTVLPEHRFDNGILSDRSRTITAVQPEGNDAHTAVMLAQILTDDFECSVTELASMLYLFSEEFSEEGETDGDSTKESSSANQSSGESREIHSGEEPVDIIAEIKRRYETDEITQEIISDVKAKRRRLPRKIVQDQQVKIEMKDLRWDDANGLLIFKDRVFVPFDDDLRATIVRQYHDSPTAGHGGRKSTYFLISQKFFWPRMTATVARYTKECQTCRRAKPFHEGKHGLLQPLPIPERFWTDITVDFITPLPICKRNGRHFQHIMVVVDRLSKQQKFVALDSLEVESVVQAFIEYVWREEGFPKSIVSDRGSQFTAHFWKAMCKRLGITPKLSTAWHPETDGQTEIMNALLKCYLRCYVNYTQNDWADWLPIAQLAANNRENSTTGIAPNMATKGYLTNNGINPDIPVQPHLPPEMKLADLNAESRTARMQEIMQVMKENMAWSQSVMAEFANRKRAPATRFDVGDRVYLDARNMPCLRESKGLDFKNLGPFEIIEVVNNAAYRLKLPDCFKHVHNVFHPWLLRLDARDPASRPTQPEGEVAHESPEGVIDYFVDAIADSRIHRGMKDPITGQKGLLQYKVLYKSSPDWNANPAWQPYHDLFGEEEAVQDFHNSNPKKPGPHPQFRELADYEYLFG